MKYNPRCLKICCLSLALLFSQALYAQQSSGSAYGESVDLSIKSAFSLVTVEATSGPLPSVSGSTPPPFNLSDSLLSVDVNANIQLAGLIPASSVDILETGVLNVATSGNTSPVADSSASVNDVNLELLGDVLLPLILGLTADEITSTAAAGGSCESGLTASGTSGLVNASLASTLAELVGITGALAANPAPNTVLLDLDLLGGHLRIVLNEQILSGDGVTSRGITVNAIHITLENLPIAAIITDVSGDVIISQSKAEVTCSSADLSLTKSDSADPVESGQPMSYTLTIDNAGPDTATNVVVSDTLPGAFSFDSANASQGSCGESSGVVTCNLGDIASGGNATVTINGTPSGVGDISNTAVVTSDAADPNPDDNSDTENTTISPAAGSADLAVTISDAPDPVIAGNTLTVTLDVANDGPDDATNTVLVYDIPAGVNIDSVTESQGSCIVTATQVICNLGTVPDGGTADVVIEMTPLLPGVLTHTAQVSSDVDDPDPDNNDDIEGSTVEVVPDAEADISIVKTDAPDPVVVGQQLTYILDVANAGPDDAGSVVVTDVLPGGLTFVSANASQGNCSHAAGTVTCNLGAVANGAGATITLVVIPTITGDINNTAVVAADVSDPDPSDNEDDETSTVGPGEADLAITKSSDPNPAIVDETLTYTLNISNAGPDNATLVQVVDVLPASVDFVLASPSQGSCGEAAGTVTCNLGTVNSGSGATITIEVTPTAAGELNNTATVDSQLDDPNTDDNTATDTNTARIREADLSVIKTSSPNPAYLNEPLTWTLAISNAGPDDAENVQVTDQLPAGVQFESASSSQGSCSEAAGVVTCDLGTVTTSGATITIVVTPTQTGELNNTVVVTSDTEDPNPDDNSDDDTTEVLLGRASFTVTKDFTDDNPAAVEVNISCNTGLPLDQSKMITEEEGVTFIVTEYDPGEMDCVITETVPNGYIPDYYDGDTNSDTRCLYENVAGAAELVCEITNTPGAVDVVIEKDWIIDGNGGNQVNMDYVLTLYCTSEIVGGTSLFDDQSAGSPAPKLPLGCYGGVAQTESADGLILIGEWCKTYEGNTSDTFVAEVIPDYPGTSCWVFETVFDSGIETDNGCLDIEVSAGVGDSCTVTNTVFFEGIPTLSEYGKALLVLLMLGVGVMAFRRLA